MICGITASQSGASSCAYPFNSDDALAISFGADGAVDMVASQTGRLVVQGGSISESRLSTDSLLTTIDFSTGKKVVEVACNSSVAALLSISAVANLRLVLVNLTGFTFASGINFSVNSGGITVEITNGIDLVVGSVVVGQNSVIGLEIDGTAGTFRAVVNGTPIVLSNNTFTPGNYSLALITAEDGISDVGDVGVTLTGEVRTDASDITQTYPPSTTDICGNPV